MYFIELRFICSIVLLIRFLCWCNFFLFLVRKRQGKHVTKVIFCVLRVMFILCTLHTEVFCQALMLMCTPPPCFNYFFESTEIQLNCFGWFQLNYLHFYTSYDRFIQQLACNLFIQSHWFCWLSSDHVTGSVAFHRGSYFTNICLVHDWHSLFAGPWCRSWSSGVFVSLQI